MTWSASSMKAQLVSPYACMLGQLAVLRLNEERSLNLNGSRCHFLIV